MARVPVYPASRPGKWKLQTIQVPAVLARFWELFLQQCGDEHVAALDSTRAGGMQAS